MYMYILKTSTELKFSQQRQHMMVYVYISHNKINKFYIICGMYRYSNRTSTCTAFSAHASVCLSGVF